MGNSLGCGPPPPGRERSEREVDALIMIMEAIRQQPVRSLRQHSGMALPVFPHSGLQEPPTRRMVSRTTTELIFAGTNLSIQGADAVGRAIKHIKGLRALDVRPRMVRRPHERRRSEYCVQSCPIGVWIASA